MRSRKIDMELLAGISHEIRNPTNVIINLAHLLKSTESQDEKKLYLDGLLETSQSLLELVNNIMDFSKVESGKLKFVFKPTELKKGIEESLTGYRSIAESRGLDFKVDIDPAIPTAVLADSVKLNQVILNIVSNAVKFTQQGEILIRAILLEKTHKEVLVGFQISDTGKGIPPEKLESIFEAFDQGSDEINLEFGGTGLGLSISKQVVTSLGGDLQVESELGTGTQFSFQLRFETIEEGQLLTEEIPEETEFAVEDATVLIVDDSALNSLVIRKCLENYGFKTLEARTGFKAINVLQKHKVELVLLDINMPEMDGFEAAGVIKKLPHCADLPIIAITGSTYRTSLDEASSEFNDFILKPFHPDELVKKVLKALR